MRFRLSSRWAVLVAVVLLLGTTGVVAGGQSNAESDVTQIGHQEIVIADEEVTISGVDATGPGFPSVDIQERTYTVNDAHLATDGLTITYNGQQYEICSVSIVVEDVSVTLEDVHLGSE